MEGLELAQPFINLGIAGAGLFILWRFVVSLLKREWSDREKREKDLMDLIKTAAAREQSNIDRFTATLDRFAETFQCQAEPQSKRSPLKKI